MAVTKHRQSATFSNLEVTGTFTVNGEVFGGTGVPARAEGGTPVPAPLARAEFPERPTVKDVARAYHDLYDALTAAGYLTAPQPPVEAPEAEVVAVQAPVEKDAPSQAEKAGVV